jgi:hypothetical protein
MLRSNDVHLSFVMSRAQRLSAACSIPEASRRTWPPPNSREENVPNRLGCPLTHSHTLSHSLVVTHTAYAHIVKKKDERERERSGRISGEERKTPGQPRPVVAFLGPPRIQRLKTHDIRFTSLHYIDGTAFGAVGPESTCAPMTS